MRPRGWMVVAWHAGALLACAGQPPPPPSSVAVVPVPPEPPAGIGPTHEAIRCGEATCALGREVCCRGGDAAPRCVAAEPSSLPCAEGERVVRCDETADCEAGSRCCVTWGCTGGCPEEQACEEKACAWGMQEVCADGAACSQGFRCDTSGAEPRCVLAEVPRPRCGEALCASGELCCWDEEKHEGVCAASCPEDGLSYACTSPSQCGGHPCAAWKLFGDPSPGLRFECAPIAQASGAYGRTICDSLADCFDRMGLSASACDPVEGMTDVRECRYDG